MIIVVIYKKNGVPSKVISLGYLDCI